MYCWDELLAPALVGDITHISSSFRKSRRLLMLLSRLFMQIQAVHACKKRHAFTNARGRETHTLSTPTSVY